MTSRSRWRRIAAISLSSASAALLLAQRPGNAPSTPASVVGKVMTVRGPVDPSELGETLIHEHLFLDSNVPDDTTAGWQTAGRVKPIGATQVGIYRSPLKLEILSDLSMDAPNRDNWILNDEKVAINEVREFQKNGGGAIVDVTSIGWKRNPLGLAHVADATGLKIVMGSSWYRKGWQGHDLDNRSVEDLTNEIVHDITVGVGDTGVRAGIIGEVGTEGNPLTPNEIKVIQASARASRITGAAITLDTRSLLHEQPKILDLIAAEGADLHRVIVGHSASIATDMDFMKKLLDRGVYIAFDQLGLPISVRTEVSDADLAEIVVKLIQAGYGNQILLSQDINTKVQLKAYGGMGYNFINQYFVRYLKRVGATDAQVDTILAKNPQRALALAAPAGAR